MIEMEFIDNNTNKETKLHHIFKIKRVGMYSDFKEFFG